MNLGGGVSLEPLTQGGEAGRGQPHLRKGGWEAQPTGTAVPGGGARL